MTRAINMHGRWSLPVLAALLLWLPLLAWAQPRALAGSRPHRDG